MMRRIVAAALWGYFGWYLAAHLASLFDLSTGVAPIGGVLMTAAALYDRRRPTPRSEGRVGRALSP